MTHKPQICDFCKNDIYSIETSSTGKRISGGLFDFKQKPLQLPFKCNYCGGTFCSKHRLPESHNCNKLKNKKLLKIYTIKNKVVENKKVSFENKNIILKVKKYKKSLLCKFGIHNYSKKQIDEFHSTSFKKYYYKHCSICGKRKIIKELL